MEDVDIRRLSYAARFAARREQLSAYAGPATDLPTYGASKRQAVAGRGGHAAWAGGMAQPVQSDSSQRHGDRRWLLVPASPIDEQAPWPAKGGSGLGGHRTAHAETVAARDARPAGSVGVGDAHVRHFQNLTLCRELQNMQLQVRGSSVV